MTTRARRKHVTPSLTKEPNVGSAKRELLFQPQSAGLVQCKANVPSCFGIHVLHSTHHLVARNGQAQNRRRRISAWGAASASSSQYAPYWGRETTDASNEYCGLFSTRICENPPFLPLNSCA